MILVSPFSLKWMCRQDVFEGLSNERQDTESSDSDYGDDDIDIDDFM